MSNIRIIKKDDTYIYQYLVQDESGKRYFVSKSGFKTQKEAQEAAEKSYKEYIEPEYYIEHNEIKVKKFDPTPKLIDLLVITTTAGIILLTVHGGNRILDDLKEKFKSSKPYFGIAAIINEGREINVEDCNFSNIYVIIRTSDMTQDTANVIHNQLNNLNLSNEIINSNSDLAACINNALSNNSDKNIVLINLEYNIESTDTIDTVIRADGYNRYDYPSDALVACISTSSKEYSFNSAVRSGEPTGGGWRRASYLEEYLISNNLENSISQLSISLPETITEDEIIRNDAASFIVEGLIRWASLPKNKRYADVYHVTSYGETITDVAKLYGVPYEYIQNNSDIDIHRLPKVGDLLVVGQIPSSAANNVRVNNPNVTDDEKEVIITENYYTVQEGDTLINIANMYGVEVSSIETLSGDPNNIQIGEVLYIPTTNYYLVHKKVNLMEENTQSMQI